MSLEEPVVKVPGEGDSKKPTVATPIPAQAAMVAAAHLPRTLWGGTPAMRAAGKLYLPQEPKESNPAYANRLKRAVLYNAFRRTVLSLRGRPFRDGLQLSEAVPEKVEAWSRNIDLTGRSLGVFARDLLADAMVTGLSHVLVEYPPAAVDGEGRPVKRRLDEEQKANHRPWLVNLPVESVIGWRSKLVGGSRVLTQVRIREWKTIDDGDYGVKVRKQIRVLEPGRFRVFIGGGRDGEDWSKPRLIAQGPTSLDTIPLFTFYTNQTGFMQARPPLQDLANLNERHWQAASDHAHIVHVANFPFLFLSGDLRGQEDDEDLVLDDEVDRVGDTAEGVGHGADSDLALGPNVLLQGKANASLSFVEHTGDAISAGERYIEKLEEQMALLGMDLLIPRVGGPESATGRVIDLEESISDLEAMTMALVGVVSDALRMAGKLGAIDLPEGEDLVAVGEGLGLSVKDATDLDALKFARLNRDISRKQYILELKRRRVLDLAYDGEKDLAEIENESPDIGVGVTGEGDTLPGGGE